MLQGTPSRTPSRPSSPFSGGGGARFRPGGSSTPGPFDFFGKPSDAPLDIEVAAAMLMARVEAAEAGGGGGGELVPPSRRSDEGGLTELERLRRDAGRLKKALLLSLQDRQALLQEQRRVADSVSSELAELRARAAIEQHEAAQQLAAARAELAATERRAAAAETDLVKVRSEAMRLQQEGKAKRSDADDQEEALKAQVSKMQREAEALVAQLREQGSGMGAAIRKALDEADAANVRAAKAERMHRQLQHQLELSSARSEMEQARLGAELAQRSADLERAEREKEALLQGLEREVAARILAEGSEKRALQTATKQLELNKSMASARAAAEVMKQHAQQLSAQRPSLVRAADPLAAAAATTNAAPAAAGGGPGSPTRRAPANAPQASPAARKAPSAHPTPAAGKGSSPTKAEPEPHHALQQLRTEHHVPLQSAVAAQKAQLTDAARSQRRALLAAQLEHAKQAEDALAAAPEYLRLALG